MDTTNPKPTAGTAGAAPAARQAKRWRVTIAGVAKPALRTDDADKKEAKLHELIQANEKKFTVTDTVDKVETTYYKEFYQQNYKVSTKKL